MKNVYSLWQSYPLSQQSLQIGSPNLGQPNFESLMPINFFVHGPSSVSVSHKAGQTFVVQLDRFVNTSFLLIFCTMINDYEAFGL